MKRNGVLLLLGLLIMAVPGPGLAQEVSLYSQDGTAVAYLATGAEMSIYLWNGDPVAYLQGESVYGFNGRHQGWFKQGIVWNREGRIAGFAEGAITSPTRVPGLKGLKRSAPARFAREPEPPEMPRTDLWAPIPLQALLALGRR